MMLIGHRGAAALEPENTLRGIDRALALGVPIIEVDVRWAGHHLYLLHDARLDRTTNRRGVLQKMAFTDVRAADAGRGERIPLLLEAIERIERRAVLNIELKGSRTARPVIALLEECLERGWVPQDFLLSGFSPAELATAKKVGPLFPRALLVGARPLAIVRTARQLGVVAVHLSRKRATPANIRACQTAGWKVRVFTVNNPAEAQALEALGVDGVFTDDPAAFPACAD